MVEGRGKLSKFSSQVYISSCIGGIVENVFHRKNLSCFSMYVKLAKKSCSVFSTNPLKTSRFFLKVFLKKFLVLSYLEKYDLFFLLHIYTLRWVRYFDTVFRRPCRCFSIVLKVILSLSDRYKLFTSDWLWIEVCQNTVVSKIDCAMTTINKKHWNR